MSDALVKATATLEFSEEQRKLIRDSFANGASDSEFGVLMEVARARRLNPLLQQIHFVKRWNSARRCEVWATQVGIDGLRAIAERTGRYDGQDEPEYEYDGRGTLKSCKVRVWRKDISRPFVGVAMFAEYVQTKKDGGGPNAMWTRGPHFMLAKCAEALALRKGFPEDMAGLYVPEEMGSEEREVNPQPPNGGGGGLSAAVAGAKALVAGQSRTELAKAKVKAKLLVVDVQPGETEAQATERSNAFPDEAAQAMSKLVALQKETGLPGEKMGSIIKGATGKPDRTKLTLDDVEKVRAAIDAVFRGEGPPPPTDADAPAP